MTTKVIYTCYCELTILLIHDILRWKILVFYNKEEIMKKIFVLIAYSISLPCLASDWNKKIGTDISYVKMFVRF